MAQALRRHLPHAYHELYAELHGVVEDHPVELKRAGPQLEHVPKHRHSLSVARHLRERIERRDHRVWVRVVRVVHESRAPLLHLAPAFARKAEPLERRGTSAALRPEALREREGEARVRHVVVPWENPLERLRHPLLARIDLHEFAARYGAKDVEPRVLLRDDAEVLRAPEDDALLPRYPVLVSEKLDVRGADVRYERRVGFGDVAEVRDLARMVRAHLEDEEVRVLRTVQYRHRKPDVVVEVALSRVDLPHCREERLHELLRRGLPRRSRHRDDLGLQRAAVFARDAVELGVSVDYPRRALLQRLRDVVVSVAPLALERHEEHPRLHLPRVEGRAREKRRGEVKQSVVCRVFHGCTVLCCVATGSRRRGAPRVGCRSRIRRCGKRRRADATRSA